MLDADLASSDVEQFRALLRDGSPGCARARCRASCRRAARRLRSAFARVRPVADGASWRAAASADRRGGANGGSVHGKRRRRGRHRGARTTGGLEPSNERAQRDLMEALARQGRYTDALRQYRVCREALRRDLDVAPEPATEALYRELTRRRRAVAADDASIDVRVETLAAVDTTPPGGPVATIGRPRSRRGDDLARGGDTRRTYRRCRRRRRRPRSGAQRAHGGAHARRVGGRAPRRPSRPADRGRDARGFRARRGGRQRSRARRSAPRSSSPQPTNRGPRGVRGSRLASRRGRCCRPPARRRSL